MRCTRGLWAALALMTVGCGSVMVEDRVLPFPPRDPNGFIPLSVRVEKGRPGVTISGVKAITQFGTVTLAPGGGTDMWQGTLALNPCVNGFGVQFEAHWNFLLSGNYERDPARGVHQKWFDAPAPGNCPQQVGHLFTVDSSADEPDANPGDGLCRIAAGTACTLRAAVMEANALPGQDRIELGSATYTLTRQGDDDNASAGDLDLLDDVAITGNGAVIESGGIGRLIDVSPSGREIDAELRGVTVRGGTVDQGAGIRNKGRLHLFSTTVRDNHASQTGGGILNDNGFVEISGSHIADNTTGMLTGAGLVSTGERGLVVVRGSSFVGNHANQHGGAISMLGGRLEMRDSTVSGNRANVHGGGLFINPAVWASLRNSTIVDNHADFDSSGGGTGGGVIHGLGDGSVFLSHVIIARNMHGGSTPDDCDGFFASRGRNLIGVDTGCNGLAGNDLKGSAASPLDPLLQSLTTLANGTRAHSPTVSSPAVDVDADPPNDARESRCTRVDQRGTERPQGPLIDGRRRCDIGALEL